MKKLSVIIPLYNVENYVARAATSVTSQAFEGLEVVVVDDGSTDKSLDVCLRHLSDLDVVVIQQENAGLSVARNAGILASSGQYLMFLDSDDFLLPNAFENILPILDLETPNVLFGRYLRWTPDRGFWSSNPYEFAPPTDYQSRTEYILCDLPDPSWNAWRYICRGDFIKGREIFFEEGMLCEDVPWTLEILEQADTISFLQEPFYAYYHRRANSIMNTLNPQRMIDLNNIVGKRLLFYKDRPTIYKKLVWQSFFYINEYCLFKRNDRKKIWASYKEILPLYRYSTAFTHRVTGRFRNSLLFHLLSMVMFVIRQTRRAWKGKLHGFDG
jgi:glycosyltransferase involved in cell wall biosynthesis